MARRGYFAQLNYPAQHAEKVGRQEELQAIGANNAAVREYEQAQAAPERARADAIWASEAQRRAAEKEAARLHVEAGGTRRRDE